MNWRFTILDRAGNETVIEEPGGWDSVVINVSRDKDKHGVFFDYSSNDFQFYGDGMRILKDEYDNYGVEGNCILMVEQDCGGSFEELYRGKFDFSQYKFISGTECYVSCPIETTSDIMTFNNRYNQAVNLETQAAFDGVTALTPYSALGRKVTFNSKGVPLFNEVDNNLSNSHNFQSGLQDPNSSNHLQYTNTQIGIGGDTEVYTEIGSFSGTLSDDTTQVDDNTTPTTQDGFTMIPNNDARFRPYFNGAFFSYESGSTNYGQLNGAVSMDIEISGNITVGKSSIADIAIILCRYNLANAKLNNFGEVPEDYEVLASSNVFYDHQNESERLQEGSSVPFSISYHNTDIREGTINLQIPKGQYYWLLFGVFDYKTQAQIDYINNNEEAYAYQINYSAGSYIKMQNLSYGGTNLSSNIKLFLANESLGRATEAITDGKMKLYSDYFGRTDSQPYAAETDGCGALEAITNGLFIRKIDESRTDTPPIMSISMQDLYTGLDCIHRIGLGVENDPERPGFKRIRVERWDYFYKSDIILVCEDIADVTHETVAEEHYSTFEIGYSTWQAQDYTGLDEFLSNRTYRTSLTAVQNDLNKESKFVASGYAIEATRRKGNSTSEDYTFDNNIFIVCLTRHTDAITYPAVNFIGGGASLSYLVIKNITTIPRWCVVGNNISVSGAIDPENNFPSAGIGGFSINGNILTIYMATTFVTSSVDQSVIVQQVAGIYVEQGGVMNPQNIVDPDTIYNYRISPVRNALRWASAVFASYKNQDDAKLIFTSGEGNFYAKGKLSDGCILEADDIQENDQIDISKFADVADSEPKLSPERISFTYPMTVKEFNEIMGNPLGLVQYGSTVENGAGWIDTIKYKPEEGTADFTLIPKYDQ